MHALPAPTAVVADDEWDWASGLGGECLAVIGAKIPAFETRREIGSAFEHAVTFIRPGDREADTTDIGPSEVVRRQKIDCALQPAFDHGFAAGLIYGLISGRSPEEALRLGWAHGALLTTFPGDVTMARLDEVEAFAKGGSARVQR